MSEIKPCQCPVERAELLPTIPFEAAELGLVKEVRGWLNTGGDINATTIFTDKDKIPSGLTLLAAACIQGQSELVKYLSTYPSIHLNTRHNLETYSDCTPLWIAAYKGYPDCVQALTTSNTACVIDICALAMSEEGKLLTPVMAAATNKHWDIVAKLCNDDNNLSYAEAEFVLKQAEEHLDWQTIKIILKKSTMLPTKTYYSLLVKAYEHNKWQIVCSILEQKFRHRIDCICYILAKIVKSGPWNHVEYLISLMNDSWKINKEIYDGVLSENLVEIQNSFPRLDENTKNGTRLAVAAIGTTEDIAPILYINNFTVTNNNIGISCFIVAAMNGNLEIITNLLENTYFMKAYGVLSRAKEAAELQSQHDTVKLLDIVMNKYAATY